MDLNTVYRNMLFERIKRPLPREFYEDTGDVTVTSHTLPTPQISPGNAAIPYMNVALPWIAPVPSTQVSPAIDPALSAQVQPGIAPALSAQVSPGIVPAPSTQVSHGIDPALSAQVSPGIVQSFGTYETMTWTTGSLGQAYETACK
jgi:hypothetical protein